MQLTSSLAIIGSLQFGLSGPMDCHVYALKCPTGIVVIDSGAGTHTEILLANLRSAFGDTKVQALIVTHCHLDHCGGAAALREKTGCQVIAPEWSRWILEAGDEEGSGLRAARLQGTYPSEIRLSPCAVDKVVRDQTIFEAGGQSFRCLHVRGHSPDSCCYITDVDGEPAIFAGDVVFYGGVLGVINVAGSGMEGYRADLAKLHGLGVQRFFPGHGVFALYGGQRHIDKAIEHLAKGFMPPQIGQGGAII